MTDGALDERPARTTATLAATTAALVAGVVGVTAGHTRSTVLAILASALLATGAWALEESRRTRQAGGSIAATAGAGVLFGVFVLQVGGTDGWMLFALFLGVALVAVDAAVGIGRDRERTISAVLRESGRALLVGFALTAVLHLALFFGVVPALLGGALGLSTATPLAGFVTLQLFVLGVGLLLPRAVTVLDRWVPADASDRETVLDSMEMVGIRTGDVPRVYVFLLGVQFVAAFFPEANALFALFFGGTLAPLLTSGVFHAPVGLAILALLGVLALPVLQHWTVVWFGSNPAQTMALQAGGLTAIVMAVLGSVLVRVVPDDPFVDVLGQIVAIPALFLGFLGVAVLAVLVLLNLGPAVASREFVPVRGSGFAVGSTLLFLGALGAGIGVGIDGVPALVVFAGVAGAILTWDLGSHATSVGKQLGQVADTRRSEFVHVTGSTLVLGGAVVLATVARYVVVPATAPARTQSASGPAVVSMILVLFALLAFVAAVHLRGRATDA